ncbi:nucleotide sugar dehydrogenase [Pseudothioglobus sp. nBUS_23]|uniref:nucleotide sugar dehydrogenase n=1 Tax=Pseudothioglobus sp. nBUS_23 TaxID=3395318 RepID=UPI003EBF8B5C
MAEKVIAVIGLGYVGLPLAVEFGKKRKVVGYDIDKRRISELKKFIDSTLEIRSKDLSDSSQLSFTSDLKDIESCSIYIVTVPTPINDDKSPKLDALEGSSKSVASVLKKNDIVIYESTVYPGATEEFCVPILEKYSGLKFNVDFFCGYSPERINPGDKVNRLINIKKVTSGSNPIIANEVDNLYLEIIKAGTHKASSIKIAEASKVVENTQRDLNIALMNELSVIFGKLKIDTEEVLLAAETKWNFLPFRPGLVGGHCIHVDPYYLAYKSLELGHNPEIILSGRRMNDGMGSYVANQVASLMEKKNISFLNANILVMGLTFKENCPDLRNTNVINLITKFQDLGCNVDVYDPWVEKENAFKEFGINIIEKPLNNKYDGIVLAVAHDHFKNIPLATLNDFGKDNFVLYDIKYILKAHEVDGRL